MAKPVGTCAHCPFPIEDSDVVVIFDDGRLIHVGCWRVSDSATSRQSSDLVRRSRKLIDDPRRRLSTISTVWRISEWATSTNHAARRHRAAFSALTAIVRGG
jgi:hypothetical protein